MDASLTLSLSQSHCNNTQESLIGSYFLEQWRLKSKTQPDSPKPDPMELDEEENEELPTELDTLNSSGGFAIVGPDKLSVHYPNVNLHGRDVGAVQANKAAPCKRLVYYFEMLVKNGGTKGQIAIGFTPPGYKLCRQPGREGGSTLNSSGGFSVVGADKLPVHYRNVNLHGHDVGVVQANRAAPCKRLVYYFEMFLNNGDTKGQIAIGFTTPGFKLRCHPGLVYYFEMFVKNGGVKGQIAIGFATPGFKLRRQPGWESNSYGYHGDDGLLYRGQGKGEDFGPVYSTGDTVGGGINYASQELFFTKNGAVVGTVFKDVKGPLFPTVAVHSQNEEVTINFGKDPFVFDLKAYEAQERAKQHSTIEKLSIPQNASYGIVRSYLQHYGYEDTLRTFDVESQSTLPPISFVQENGFAEDMNTYSLNQRKVLRKLIRNGQIGDAFGKLREWYPQMVQDGTSAICFLLHCQNFIELVRVGKLEEAVLYGRTEFEKFYKLGDYDDLVKDCAALLAYEQPQKSSVGYLLGDSQREIVADAVNATVLSTNPSVKDSREFLHSRLDRLLRQLSASFLEKRSLNGDQGEGFHLHRILNSGRKG